MDVTPISRTNLISLEQFKYCLGALIFSSVAIAAHGGAASLAALDAVRPPSFSAIAKKTMPVVVNISTSSERAGRSNDPIEDFFNRFFGETIPKESNQRSLGSGILINKDGEILTNYHVVRSADTIKVKLADHTEYEARLVGKDDRTDLALVKIRKAGGNIPFAKLGTSSQLDVGDWVMAIGNPFGLDHTVTSGIVSAKGRQIGAGPYDSFIQTDASINPGNSGGPLLNMRGEVVGINTAIFSQSGGNIGIGFAIPTNLVKGELPQLKDKGKVVRGYLGTVIQRVTPELADTLGLKSPRGALVAETTKDGPAARAGIRAGDVIVEFNGKEIKDSSDLPLEVASVTPGTTVQMKVLRDSKEMTLPITVGEMKENEVAASTEEEGDFGLAVQTVTPEVADSLGLGRVEGVVVNSVKPGSAADEAGLQRGDVI